MASVLASGDGSQATSCAGATDRLNTKNGMDKRRFMGKTIR